MKRIYTAIGIILLAPIFYVFCSYFVTLSLQPETVEVKRGEEFYGTSYIEENKFHEVTGEFTAIPGKIVAPENYSDDSDGLVTINSLEAVKNEEFKVGNKYVGTIAFALNLPSKTSYALWFPAEFCEYRVYVNGVLSGESETFDTDNPLYPNSFYVELPADEVGSYKILINFESPVNYVNNDSSALLLGTYSKTEGSYSAVKNAGLLMFTICIFSLVYDIMQYLAMGRDKRLIGFLVMSITTALVMSFTDGRFITDLFPMLTYQVGVFFSAMATPLFLLSLMIFSYCIYKDSFPEKIGLIFAVLQLIPLANALCLNRFKILSMLAIFVSIIPFGVCLYIFALEFEKKTAHCISYGIGILLIEGGILLSYATQGFAIPARFVYAPGYLVFSFLTVAILADEYAKQNRDEKFYADELSRQLATMQASENAFLNAQMKPHFLYNTLNTIADCCVTDSEKAKKLINSLSEYLKLILSLDNMDETVPLRRELELAEAYTAIEKERFPSINFFTEYPVKLPSIMMPPITIQPLIENAIKHGVRKSDKPGVVTLRIIENPDFVEFFVSDNGNGMSEETIQNLFKKPKENQSIGIYNIDKRLKNLYKKGLVVESTPGLGTCVSFKVYKYM